ncbi:MAG: amidohydrolase family protein, partial [Clostridia bacterium]|nr:amidohydrolase family protein [Clostridia bacterium]
MKGFKGVKAYICGEIKTVDIGIENGKIAFVGNGGDIESICEVNGVLLPGFIDEHIHGAGGADAMDATAESLQTISEYLAKEGTTAFLATTRTQSEENIKKALKNAANVINKGEFKGAEVLGVHLEGPFISPKHVGAQPLEYVVKPSAEKFAEYQKAADGYIKIVTLAPEEEGGAELISALCAQGVVPSIGHTAAKYDDVVKAVESGLK